MSHPLGTSLAFIDTNVWLYAFIDNQDPRKAQIAKELLRNTPNIVVGLQVINEVCVNLVKNELMDEADIRVLIDTFYAKHHVIDLTYDILQKASHLRERFTLSFWDSLIIATAIISGCTYVVSEDMQDGLRVENQLTIVNPFK